MHFSCFLGLFCVFFGVYYGSSLLMFSVCSFFLGGGFCFETYCILGVSFGLFCAVGCFGVYFCSVLLMFFCFFSIFSSAICDLVFVTLSLFKVVLCFFSFKKVTKHV